MIFVFKLLFCPFLHVAICTKIHCRMPGISVNYFLLFLAVENVYRPKQMFCAYWVRKKWSLIWFNWMRMQLVCNISEIPAIILLSFWIYYPMLLFCFLTKQSLLPPSKSIFQNIYFVILRWCWRWCGISIIAWTIPISVYIWRGNRKIYPFVTLQAKPFAFSRLTTLQTSEILFDLIFFYFPLSSFTLKWFRELKCFQSRLFPSPHEFSHPDSLN